MQTYTDLKDSHQQSPSFFMYCAKIVLDFSDEIEVKTQREDQIRKLLKTFAAQICTNCLELNLQDVQMMRSVGYFLIKSGEMVFAFDVLDRIRDLAPVEPQSFLDGALARYMYFLNLTGTIGDGDASTTCKLSKANAVMAVEMVKKAVELTTHAITHKWAKRFDEIEWPALILLHLLEQAGNELTIYLEGKDHQPDIMQHRISIVAKEAEMNTTADDTLVPSERRGNSIVTKMIDPNVPTTNNKTKFWPSVDLPIDDYHVDNFKLGLVIWLQWDTDHTDIDLHVQEPNGNEVYYGRRQSPIGGNLSKDFTQGYGPEIYTLKAPVCGKYIIKAKYYASHQESKLTGATNAVLWTLVGCGSTVESSNTTSIANEKVHEQKAVLPNKPIALFNTVQLDTHKEKMNVFQVQMDNTGKVEGQLLGQSSE